MRLAILSPDYNEIAALVSQCRNLNIEVMHVNDATQILSVLKNGITIDMFITKLGKTKSPSESPWEIINHLRKVIGNEDTFICFYSFKASQEIGVYDNVTKAGANMVTSSVANVFQGILFSCTLICKYLIYF